MSPTNNFRNQIADYWQSAMTFILMTGGFLSLAIYRLAELIPIVTSKERSLYNSSTSLMQLLDDPLNPLPKLATFTLRYFNQDSLFTVRLISAAAALASLGLLYYVLCKWFSVRVAILTFILLATSSWFLTVSRQASVDIFYVLLISAGFAYGAWTRTTKHSGVVMGVGIGLALLYLYTPGLVWVALVVALWQGKSTVRHITEAPKTTILALTGVAVGASPLLYAIYKAPNLGLDVMGVSRQPLVALQHSGSRSLEIVQTLLYHGPVSAQDGLLGVAHFDVFTLACVVLGAASFWGWRKLDRFRATVGMFIIAILLVCLQGVVPLAVLIPVVYLVVAAGISSLLERWFRVFPRNPVARSLGLGLVTAVVGLTVFYHIEKYYIAWPQSPETRAELTGSSSLR